VRHHQPRARSGDLSDADRAAQRASPRANVVLTPDAKRGAIDAATAAGVSLSAWLESVVRAALGLPPVLRPEPKPAKPKRPRGRPRKSTPTPE